VSAVNNGIITSIVSGLPTSLPTDEVASAVQSGIIASIWGSLPTSVPISSLVSALDQGIVAGLLNDLVSSLPVQTPSPVTGTPPIASNPNIIQGVLSGLLSAGAIENLISSLISGIDIPTTVDTAVPLSSIAQPDSDDDLLDCIKNILDSAIPSLSLSLCQISRVSEAC
jgi:hypothetical protein